MVGRAALTTAQRVRRLVLNLFVTVLSPKPVPDVRLTIGCYQCQATLLMVAVPKISGHLLTIRNTRNPNKINRNSLPGCHALAVATNIPDGKLQGRLLSSSTSFISLPIRNLLIWPASRLFFLKRLPQFLKRNITRHWMSTSATTLHRLQHRLSSRREGVHVSSQRTATLTASVSHNRKYTVTGLLYLNICTPSLNVSLYDML